MKFFIFFIPLLFLISCGNSSNSSNNISNNTYPIHKDITSTVFWVGEDASSDNQNISNYGSVWDDYWTLDYGGIDEPNSRDGYYPKDFIPLENPFYFALPYNDFDKNGNKKDDILDYIPWAKKDDNSSLSICKNRWIKIIKGDKVAYAQWEDAGPFGEDDKEYVFGNSLPKNSINQNAGLDLSPAVRDYLGLNDIDKVSWQFVDSSDVPNGPWKEIITTTNINFNTWYKPDINTTWQWQLDGEINTDYNVDLYDIDLFDSNKELIDLLHSKGKKVICYFSAGSYENWREDKDSFPSSVLGNNLDNWEGERWLDIRQVDILLPIMKKRLDLAKSKGCDGVEPDNVDGYQNNTGFSISAKEQARYNKLIAKEAHLRGLSVGLKNDLDQIKELEKFFDFAVNEECFEYDECDKLKVFTDNNKAVFNAEYNEIYLQDSNKKEELCQKANELHIQTLILPIELNDSFRYSCSE